MHSYLKLMVLLAFCCNSECYNRDVELLKKYGYLPTNGKYTKQEYKEAVLKFQKVGHLPETGAIDEQTHGKLLSKRCGDSDEKILYTALIGGRWNRTGLTYNILNLPKNVERKKAELFIHRAFSAWSLYTPLVFKRQYKDADINIAFIPLDGEGFVLAKTYYPIYGGDIFFDDQEEWTITTQGTDMFAVAVHEIGHALGLGHINHIKSIMNPYYAAWIGRRTNPLNIRDIVGIRTLYGSNKSEKKKKNFKKYHK